LGRKLRNPLAEQGILLEQARLTAALEPDDVVLGGGNVKRLKELPPKCRAGDNANAFLGGFRLWESADQPPLVPRTSANEGRNRITGEVEDEHD
jgi:hypothetical protein